MSGLAAAVVVVGGLAFVLGGLRFLRVAQREHYLPGSATRFALRWWSARPLALAGGALAVLGAASTTPALWPGLATAACVAAGPPGFQLRGRTSPLAWTRRLRTLAAATALLGAGACAAAGAAAGLRAAATAAATLALLEPVVEDAALLVLRPFEERLAARHVRRAAERLARVRPTVVAITGSYGKTSTKGYLAHLLDGRMSVLASPRSFNNRAGLSRTVNELLSPGTDVLIAEMGTYGPGEIAALCAWMRPRIAVLTAIGPVHLERFKSLDRTLAAKAEIAAGAEVVVVNADDERLAGLARRLEQEGLRVLRASAGRPADPAPPSVVVRPEGGALALEVGGEAIGTARLAAGAGLPAATNVACAAAAALALGLRPAEILERLAGLPVAEHRLSQSVTPAGVVVLDDTFNANPAGAALALAELARKGAASRRRAVVSPGMVELGPLQAAENACLAAAATKVATDLVLTGRTNRRAMLAGARRDGAGGCRLVLLGTRDEAVGWVRAQLAAGDVVLYENDLPDHYP